MKPAITIEYCPKYHWLLRSAYMAQEILTTFTAFVTLRPSEIIGRYTIYVVDEKLFDRKEYGGSAEIKEIKQLVRDRVTPGKTMGHTDTPTHHLY